MDIPEHIGFNHIKTSIFCLQYQILPHLNQSPFLKQIRKIQKSHKNDKGGRTHFGKYDYRTVKWEKIWVPQECFWGSVLNQK
jgi:hypothetical protein